VLVVLCVTEITNWGVLYYAFPVLAPSIAADTGWSLSVMTTAFSVGLVVSALVGILVRRWLDRFGPRPVMSIASMLAVPAVVGIAVAPSSPVFFCGVGGGRGRDGGHPLSACLRRPHSLVGAAAGDRVDRGDPARRAGQHDLRPDYYGGPAARVGLAAHLRKGAAPMRPMTVRSRAAGRMSAGPRAEE
jgi:MFS family permease